MLDTDQHIKRTLDQAFFKLSHCNIAGAIRGKGDLPLNCFSDDLDDEEEKTFTRKVRSISKSTYEQDYDNPACYDKKSKTDVSQKNS